MTLILNDEDVGKALSMEQCIEALEKAYKDLGEGTAVSTGRRDSFLATTHPDAYYSFKTIDGGLEQDRVLLEPTYQSYAKLFPDYPVPSASSFKSLFEFLCPRNPKACAANPRDLIDASFVESLRKEHFVESLSGSKQRY